MLFLYFRQNAGAGKEELKVGGGSISMIVDVFIHCKYWIKPTRKCDVGLTIWILLDFFDGSNPERGIPIKKNNLDAT